MRVSRTTKQFRRHYEKLDRSGKNMEKLKTVMRMIAYNEPLPAKHRDHALHGKFLGLRDCHIEGDWLLLYELGKDADGQDVVVFHATDTHENLLG